MILSDKECGFGGPKLFLRNRPMGGRAATSLSGFLGFGVEPRERGEPVTVQVKGLPKLLDRVQTAACIQAVYRRGLHGVPMCTPVDPSHPISLLRGSPEALKILFVSWGGNSGTISPSEPPVQVWTWAEMLHNTFTHGHKMG